MHLEEDNEKLFQISNPRIRSEHSDSVRRATSNNAKCPGAEEKEFHDSNGSIPTTGVVDGRQGVKAPG